MARQDEASALAAFELEAIAHHAREHRAAGATTLITAGHHPSGDGGRVSANRASGPRASVQGSPRQLGRGPQTVTPGPHVGSRRGGRPVPEPLVAPAVDEM